MSVNRFFNAVTNGLAIAAVIIFAPIVAVVVGTLKD
jgi:hypothetical protein|nr:MAG TPA: hypothetical protein [Caudoviricetes sp.]